MELILVVAAIYAAYLALAGVFAQVFSPRDDSVGTKVLFFLALAFLVPGLIVVVWWGTQRLINLLSRIADTLQDIRGIVDQLDRITDRLATAVEDAQLSNALNESSQAVSQLNETISRVDIHGLNETVGVARGVLNQLGAVQTEIGAVRLVRMFEAADQILDHLVSLRDELRGRVSTGQLAVIIDRAASAPAEYEDLKRSVRRRLDEMAVRAEEIRMTLVQGPDGLPGKGRASTLPQEPHD